MVNVCVVDENDMNAKLMQRKLLSIDASFQVHLVASAQEAVAQCQKYDVLIIDNDFGPECMSGVEAINSIREEFGKTPIIVLWTAEEMIHAPGADLMWDKAVAPDTMWDQLSRALGLA